MLFRQSGLISGDKTTPWFIEQASITELLLDYLNCAYSLFCEFCHVTDGMPLVQKVEKKSDLDDVMNEAQEKIEEKDSEFAVL